MKRIIIIVLVAASVVLLPGCAPTINEAAQDNHIDEVVSMLDKGVDVDTEDSDGNTPLALCASYGRSEIAKILISKGAKVNHRDKHGNTPLYNAANKGYLDVAKLLVHRGANVNSVDNAGWTPLAAASSGGYTEIVNLLIIKGAKVNLAVSDGDTPLTLASFKGHAETANLLIKHGAQFSQREHSGKTAPERQIVLNAKPAATVPVQPQPAQPQKVAEATPIADCLSLAAALKACDQTGGFMAMGCKAVARSQYNCPAMR